MNCKNNSLFKKIRIVAVLVFVEQFSKYLIRSKGGFYICNPNISWGISVNNYFFVLFWAVFVLILLFFLFKPAKILNFKFSIFNEISNSKFQIINLPLSLILAGAISNMIDRLIYGCVIDFIDLKFWPIFNLADIFIVLGAAFLLVKWRKL